MREVLAHKKPVYKHLSQVSKNYFYLRGIGQSMSNMFREISAFSSHLTNSDLRWEKRLSDPSFEDIETDL